MNEENNNGFINDSGITTLDRLLAITPIISSNDNIEELDKKLTIISNIYNDILLKNDRFNTTSATKLLHFISISVQTSNNGLDPKLVVERTFKTLSEMKSGEIDYNPTSIFQGGFWGVEIASVMVLYKDKIPDEEFKLIINSLINDLNTLTKIIPFKTKMEEKLTKNSLSKELSNLLRNQMDHKSPLEAYKAFARHVEMITIITKKIVKNFEYE